VGVGVRSCMSFDPSILQTIKANHVPSLCISMFYLVAQPSFPHIVTLFYHYLEVFLLFCPFSFLSTVNEVKDFSVVSANFLAMSRNLKQISKVHLQDMFLYQLQLWLLSVTFCLSSSNYQVVISYCIWSFGIISAFSIILCSIDSLVYIFLCFLKRF
jgi:hypothetical protein